MWPRFRVLGPGGYAVPSVPRASGPALTAAWLGVSGRSNVGSVIKKRRKRMAKKKHRKLLKKTRIQRRRQGK